MEVNLADFKRCITFQHEISHLHNLYVPARTSSANYYLIYATEGTLFAAKYLLIRRLSGLFQWCNSITSYWSS